MVRDLVLRLFKIILFLDRDAMESLEMLRSRFQVRGSSIERVKVELKVESHVVDEPQLDKSFSTMLFVFLFTSEMPHEGWLGYIFLYTCFVKYRVWCHLLGRLCSSSLSRRETIVVYPLYLHLHSLFIKK